MPATKVGCTNGRVSLSHIYELSASPSSLSELLQVPVTSQRLPTNVLVLVLDLSSPSTMCQTALQWLTSVRKVATEALKKLKKAKAGEVSLPELLSAQRDVRMQLGYAQRGGQAVPPVAVTAGAKEAQPQSEQAESSLPAHALWDPRVCAHLQRTLPEHPDRAMLSATWSTMENEVQIQEDTRLSMPLLIVGNKWDALKNEEGPKRRAVLSALRYVAHAWGASLVVCSMGGQGASKSGDKAWAAMQAARQMMLAAAFGLPARTGMTCDSECVHPPILPAGADSLDSILQAVGTSASVRRSDLEGGPFAARLKVLEAGIHQYYPPAAPSGGQRASSTGAGSVVPARQGPDGRWTFLDAAATLAPEPVMDGIRQQKYEELAKMQAAAKADGKRAPLDVKGLLSPAPKQDKGAVAEA